MAPRRPRRDRSPNSKPTASCSPRSASLPVVVFWHDGAAYAIEDRCPHLGFPLHQGTVEAGLVTCHWHHARFDLVSGCTLDLWADDARGFDADVRDGDVFVAARADADPVGHLQTRLREGLEDSITLVDRQVGARPARRRRRARPRSCAPASTSARRTATPVGARASPCSSRWRTSSPTSTPTTARSRSRTGSRSSRATPATMRRASRRARSPTNDVPLDRLAGWYRRFIDTRSSDAAERTLETALADGNRARRRRGDDVRGGDRPRVHRRRPHDRLHEQGVRGARPPRRRRRGRRCCRRSCCRRRDAQRSEEFSEWRHPHDLVPLAAATVERLGRAPRPARTARSTSARSGGSCSPTTRSRSPTRSSHAHDDGRDRRGARPRARVRGRAAHRALPRAERPRRLGHRAPLVHRGERAAPGACGATRTPELRRGCVHAALRIYLDRFLNVPAARLPHAATGILDALAQCFDVQGMVDEAGNEAYGFLRGGGSRAELDRRARPRAARRRRRVPLVPDRRSRRAPGGGVARGLGGVRARPRRRSPASSPRTPRRAASCRPSCGSPSRLRRGEALYEDDE